MDFNSESEILHNSKLLQLAMNPEIIGLEKIKKCRMEFPVFPNWEGLDRISEYLFLVNKYKFNDTDILVYNYETFQRMGKGVSINRENEMGNIDLVFNSDLETIAVEYKKNGKRYSDAKIQLTKAQKGLWKNYGIVTNHLYYIFGENFEAQELIDNRFLPLKNLN